MLTYELSLLMNVEQRYFLRIMRAIRRKTISHHRLTYVNSIEHGTSRAHMNPAVISQRVSVKFFGHGRFRYAVFKWQLGDGYPAR